MSIWLLYFLCSTFLSKLEELIVWVLTYLLFNTKSIRVGFQALLKQILYFQLNVTDLIMQDFRIIVQPWSPIKVRELETRISLRKLKWLLSFWSLIVVRAVYYFNPQFLRCVFYYSKCRNKILSINLTWWRPYWLNFKLAL